MAITNRNTFAHPVICLLVLIFAIIAPGCNLDSDKQTAIINSDPQAVEIAEAVIDANGGRENWEKTRYITWRFFGKRLNVWDKLTGDIRLESRSSIILMNLNTQKGRAWRNGEELTEPDDLQRAMEYGYGAWINDSYWMFMPFKLLDEGVTLKYLGEGEIGDSLKTDILSLTFNNVGHTPENKYHVQIDKETNLVVHWTYYMDAADEHPRFNTPWKDYRKYGNILLSGDRGEKQHTDIAVFEKMPESVFTDPEPLDWAVVDSLNNVNVKLELKQ